MKIDSHVHMPSQKNVWSIEHFSGKQYLNLMDQLGIDRSFILPLDGLFFDPESTNNALLEWCEIDRTRLIPFFTFEPRSAKAKEEITRCFETLGMKGVKLHTWLQGFRPTEDCMLDLAQYLAQLGLPVLFHDGTPPYSTPLQIADLARFVPNLKIILGHGGLYDFSDEAISAASQYPNIYVSMTSLPTYYMKKILAQVPIHQILFGSDGGLNSIEKHDYVQIRWSMLESLQLQEPTLKQILELNPLRVLGEIA